LTTTLLTRMTSISLLMQWPLTSELYGLGLNLNHDSPPHA
jgi:hypothetical protein